MTSSPPYRNPPSPLLLLRTPPKFVRSVRSAILHQSSILSNLPPNPKGRRYIRERIFRSEFRSRSISHAWPHAPPRQTRCEREITFPSYDRSMRATGKPKTRRLVRTDVIFSGFCRYSFDHRRRFMAAASRKSDFFFTKKN